MKAFEILINNLVFNKYINQSKCSVKSFQINITKKKQNKKFHLAVAFILQDEKVFLKGAMHQHSPRRGFFEAPFSQVLIR